MVRLRSLIGRSSCPPRPTGGLLSRWHQASGTPLSFNEWCDPSAQNLAEVLRSAAVPRREVDAAVVAFAEARSGADHTAEAVATDLVALVDVLEGSEDAQHDQSHDAVDLVARALTAWAREQVEVVSAGSCTDPVTGLVTGGFLRARLRELHAQCEALAIAPPMTFGSLVVQLMLGDVPAPERIEMRLAVARALLDVFRAGETVAVLGASRFVAVMPAYALEIAEDDLRGALVENDQLEAPVSIQRRPFEGNPEASWRSLVGIGSGA